MIQSNTTVKRICIQARRIHSGLCCVIPSTNRQNELLHMDHRAFIKGIILEIERNCFVAGFLSHSFWVTFSRVNGQAILSKNVSITRKIVATMGKEVVSALEEKSGFNTSGLGKRRGGRFLSDGLRL